MLKLIIGGRRRAGMSHRDYSRYAQDVHGGMVASNPGEMLGYLQNHVLDSVRGTRAAGWSPGPDFDSFSEISFSDRAALMSSITDPFYRDVIQPDELNFVCHSAVILLTTRVAEERVPNPGPGSLKVMRLVAPVGGVDPEVFEARWRQEAGRIANHPHLRPLLRRFTRSINLAAGQSAGLPDGFVANAHSSPYAGVESLWFDADDAWTAVDAYRAAIEDAESHLSGLIDRRLEALFVVEEVVIVSDGFKSASPAVSAAAAELAL